MAGLWYGMVLLKGGGTFRMRAYLPSETSIGDCGLQFSLEEWIGFLLFCPAATERGMMSMNLKLSVRSLLCLYDGIVDGVTGWKEGLPLGYHVA